MLKAGEDNQCRFWNDIGGDILTNLFRLEGAVHPLLNLHYLDLSTVGFSK